MVSSTGNIPPKNIGNHRFKDNVKSNLLYGFGGCCNKVLLTKIRNRRTNYIVNILHIYNYTYIYNTP